MAISDPHSDEMGYALGQQLWAESIKAIPSLVVALLTLAVGWVVGNRLTAKWDERKKRRELDLQALGAFYAAYGKFTAIWRLWDGGRSEPPSGEDFRREVLEQAARVEGELESLLVRITAERTLSDRDCTLLGCFRQGFQSLRRSITAERRLRSRIRHPRTHQLVEIWWDSSDSPPYLAFKALSGHVADLLSKDLAPAAKPLASFEALAKITANGWERTWVDETFRALQLQSPSWPPPA
ncbi:hypothetical protein [Sphaerisporangium sp. NPDC051011]|uniref:hypothetical protein n=1 Tax=Sphaerisporangium sp. NPDC051011 TaxID=3155792 RepID=UPI0033E9633C